MEDTTDGYNDKPKKKGPGFISCLLLSLAISILLFMALTLAIKLALK